MKKFITIALAVAVLFSFAACQQSTPAVYRQTGDIALKSDVVYLVGETIDPEDLIFTVYTYDGSAVNVPAAEIDFPETEIKAESQYVSVTWTGITLSGYVDAFTASSIKVDASASSVKKLYYATDYSTDEKYTNDLLSLDGVVITATYTDENDAEQTKVVDNSAASAEIANWSTAGSADVTVSFGTATPDTYKVTLAENRVASVEIELVDEDEVFYLAKNAQGATPAIADADFKVIKTYDNGEKKEVTENPGDTTYKYADLTGLYTQTAPVTTSYTSAGEVTINARYLGDDGNADLRGDARNMSVRVTVAKDEVESLTVTGPTEGKVENKDYGSTTSPFTKVVANWKSGSSNTTELEYTSTDKDYTLSITDFSGYAIGDYVEVTITATSEFNSIQKTVGLVVKAAAV